MKFYIDSREYQTAEDCAQDIIDHLGEDVYDELLNEAYGEIEICGYSYNAALALYRVDPIAYRCGMNDYYDSLYSELVDDLERMADGDTEAFYGAEVEAVDDEDEDK